jgi:LEA14-like dessication related protein
MVINGGDMKKLWFLSVLPTVILLTSCSIIDKGLMEDMFKKPKISVENTEFKGLDLEKVSLLVHMRIKNENPFSVTFRGIDYGLYIDRSEMPLISSSVRETINIEAEQDNPVSFPVDLYYREIMNLDFSKTDILLGLKGHALLQTIVGNIKIPFDLEKSVPVPRLPEFSVIKLKLISLNVLQKTASLQLTLGVHNRNSFPLPLNSFSFNLALEGVKVSRENKQDNIIVKPQDTEHMNLFIDLDLAKIKVVLERILQGKPVKFKLDGSYGLDSPRSPEGLFPFSDIGESILEL